MNRLLNDYIGSRISVDYLQGDDKFVNEGILLEVSYPFDIYVELKRIINIDGNIINTNCPVFYHMDKLYEEQSDDRTKAFFNKDEQLKKTLVEKIGDNQVIYNSRFFFAGPLNGIINIKHNEEKIYSNDKLPSVYPEFDLFKQSDVDNINLMRENMFGTGFEYEKF